ncbi:MAG: hypothetical protein VX438_13560 [Planctomycetota bacterium]|nr:hypothetical protein [Planctomycetota bacterium]
MRKPIDSIVSGLWLFSIAVASVGAQEFDPTQVKGDLQKIKAPLASLLQLKSSNGRLAPEFEKDRQAAYKLVSQINSIGGNRGGGSSSSGTHWEIRINSNKFQGYCNYGYSRVYPNPKPNTWRLQLKELAVPNRDFSLEAGPNGEVAITLYGGEDPYLLRIRQLKSGSIFVQEVSDTEIFSESSSSFDVFCRQHSKFTQERLLPMIRHLGIDAPMTQFDKVVQESVITFLTPIKEEQLTSFQTSFRNLDSADYDKRKADSERLSEGFKDWRDFVLRAVNDSDFSYEVRFRLMEVLEKNGTPNEIKASRYAISTDLANNPQYLVWLYDQYPDPVIRENILGQLREATGENLGGVIADWKSKYENDNRLVIKPSNQPPVNLLVETGAIDMASRHVAQLVRLKLVDQRLKLDRDYWSEQFGGKSIQQLVKETNANLAKLNLPASYDPDPLFELGSVSHPQAIFAKLRNKMQATRKNSSVYYYSYNRASSSSLNRQFNNNELNVSMNFEPPKKASPRVVNKSVKDVKPPNLSGKPFKLDLNELKNSRRSLMVQERADGWLRVALVTEKSNSVVQFLQQPDGQFVVQDVRGSDIFTAKGKTFQEFRDNHGDYCNEKLFPLFYQLGLSFTEDLFKGPPRESLAPKTGSSKEDSTNKKDSTNSAVQRNLKQIGKELRNLQVLPGVLIPRAVK